MSNPDQQMLESNWARMRAAIDRAALEYVRIADDLRVIKFDGAAGVRRSPDAIISQAALTADASRVHADMVHRLATWAETINEILQHQALEATGSRNLCPVRTTAHGDTWECVLGAGHSGPELAGQLLHVTSAGATFS